MSPPPAKAGPVSPVPNRRVSPPLVTCISVTFWVCRFCHNINTCHQYHEQHLSVYYQKKMSEAVDLKKDVVKGGHVDGEALEPALVPPSCQNAQH